MKQHVKSFKALADPSRIRTLKMLEEGPLCVCEIAYVLGLAASTVSKHLSILKEADFIVDEKEGKWVNYRLNPDPEKPANCELLNMMQRTLTADETIQSDRDKMRSADRTVLCAGLSGSTN